MSDSVVVVGGGGHMGSCAVAALLAEGFEVVVADRRPSTVDGARFVEADARDREAIERLAEGASLVMNFTGPYYLLGDVVARATIAKGVPYIDICDDAAATEQMLALGDEARDAGVALVLGVGSSPGFLNGLALRAAEGFGSLTSLTLFWVEGERSHSAVAPLQHFFYGITQEIPIWRGGAREVVPAFTAESAEEFPFPEPIGKFTVRDVGHPETVTLPLALEVQEVRNKGATIPQRSIEVYDMLRRLGLMSDEPVSVGGVDVVPRDFVAELLTKRHNENADDGGRDMIGLGVRATGVIDGRTTDRCFATVAKASIAEVTALPTVAAVPQLIADKVSPGAHGPEALNVEEWFGELARLAPTVYKEIEIWEDGGDRKTLSFEEFARIADPGELIGR